MDPRSKSDVLDVRDAAEEVAVARARGSVAAVVSAHARPGQTLVASSLRWPELEQAGFAPLDVCVLERHAVHGLSPLEGALVLQATTDRDLPRFRDEAPLFVQRGVRRMFAVAVDARRLLEWWPAMGDLAVYAADVIEDRMFERPLETVALFDEEHAAEAITRCMVARDTWPIPLVREEVLVRERQEALLRVLEARKLRPSRTAAARIAACVDPGRLARWIDRACFVRYVEELFAKDG